MQQVPQVPIPITTGFNAVIPQQTPNIITPVRPTIPVPTIVVPTVVPTQTQFQVPTAVIPTTAGITTVARPVLPVVPPLGQTAPTVPRPMIPSTPTVQVPTVPRPVIPSTPTVQVPTTVQPGIPPTPTVQVPTITRPVVPPIVLPATVQPIIPITTVQPIIPPTVQQTIIQPIVPAITQTRPIIPPTPKITIPAEALVVQQTPTVPQQVVVFQTTVPVIPKPQTITQGGILKQFGGAGAGVVAVTATPQITATPVINIIEETGYSILTKLLHIWNGTPEQAQVLANLQYINGNYIIDINRRDVITEIIGMLTRQDFDEVIDFLTDAPDPSFVLWEQEAMDEGRLKVAREMIIQQAAETGVKGVGKCRYCPSTELVFALKQLRSGDEPATIFVRCVMCQKQWRQ
ncbi:Transcription elongation factor TFIIS [uncultured virus]|nr:Transcription elongation factor TFIIS [uncultured virus]